MTPAQKRAMEIFLDSAVLENNFTPHSEARIAKALEAEGYEGSSSSVGRWKSKFNWVELLNAKITASLGEDNAVKEMVKHSSLELAVKKTEVDVQRNSTLIAASYQALEHDVRIILEGLEKHPERRLSEEDFKRVFSVARLSTERHDKMLDRLANMPVQSLSTQEVIERLNSVTLELESDVVEIQIEE